MRSQFNKTQKKKILTLLDEIGGDGHTIFKASILKGFPKALRDRFTKEHTSDPESGPKSTLFAKGRAMEKIKGVYGLTVLQWICHDLDIPYDSYSGRGFQARELTRVIREHFK